MKLFALFVVVSFMARLWAAPFPLPPAANTSFRTVYDMTNFTVRATQTNLVASVSGQGTFSFAPGVFAPDGISIFPATGVAGAWFRSPLSIHGGGTGVTNVTAFSIYALTNSSDADQFRASIGAAAYTNPAFTGPITLAGIPYSWPNPLVGPGTVLSDNGFGLLSWVPIIAERVDTLADLVSYTGSATNVYTLGHTTVNDGGGGLFYWVANSLPAFSTSTNNGTVVTNINRFGNWVRVLDRGQVNFNMFGGFPSALCVDAVSNTFNARISDTRIHKIGPPLPGEYLISHKIVLSYPQLHDTPDDPMTVDLEGCTLKYSGGLARNDGYIVWIFPCWYSGMPDVGWSGSSTNAMAWRFNIENMNVDGGMLTNTVGRVCGFQVNSAPVAGDTFTITRPLIWTNTYTWTAGAPVATNEIQLDADPGVCATNFYNRIVVSYPPYKTNMWTRWYYGTTNGILFLGPTRENIAVGTASGTWATLVNQTDTINERMDDCGEAGNGYQQVAGGLIIYGIADSPNWKAPTAMVADASGLNITATFTTLPDFSLSTNLVVQTSTSNNVNGCWPISAVNTVAKTVTFGINWGAPSAVYTTGGGYIYSDGTIPVKSAWLENCHIGTLRFKGTLNGIMFNAPVSNFRIDSVLGSDYFYHGVGGSCLTYPWGSNDVTNNLWIANLDIGSIQVERGTTIFDFADTVTTGNYQRNQGSVHIGSITAKEIDGRSKIDGKWHLDIGSVSAVMCGYSRYTKADSQRYNDFTCFYPVIELVNAQEMSVHIGDLWVQNCYRAFNNASSGGEGVMIDNLYAKDTLQAIGNGPCRVGTMTLENVMSAHWGNVRIGSLYWKNLASRFFAERIRNGNGSGGWSDNYIHKSVVSYYPQPLISQTGTTNEVLQGRFFNLGSPTAACRVTSLVRSTGVSTYTTTVSHGFFTGDKVTVTACTDDATFNITNATITVTSTNTFTAVQALGDAGPTTETAGYATLECIRGAGWPYERTSSASTPSVILVGYENSSLRLKDCLYLETNWTTWSAQKFISPSTSTATNAVLEIIGSNLPGGHGTAVQNLKTLPLTWGYGAPLLLASTNIVVDFSRPESSLSSSANLCFSSTVRGLNVNYMGCDAVIRIVATANISVTTNIANLKVMNGGTFPVIIPNGHVGVFRFRAYNTSGDIQCSYTTTYNFSAAGANVATNLVIGTGTSPGTTMVDVGPAAAGTNAMLISGGIQTVSAPAVTVTQNWNAAGTTFIGGVSKMTTTASGANSLIHDFQSGAAGAEVSVLGVRKDGALLKQDQQPFMLVSPGEAVAGNARGVFAVDLQMGRNNATYVASGASSFLGGGTNCVASGGKAAVVAGNDSVASGNSSTVIAGSGCTASGFTSVASGYQCLASADQSMASGAQAVATHYTEFARASRRFSANGDAQLSIMTARRSITAGGGSGAGNTNTWCELFLDGDSSGQRMTLPSTNSVWAFRVQIVGKATTAGVNKGAAYVFEGCIKKTLTTTSLVGAVAPGLAVEDDAAWDARVTADDTNDSLLIEVYSDVEPSRWVATVTLTQVMAP